MPTSGQKKLTPRQIAKRQAILEAVRRLIQDRAYDELNIRDIASEAGVSPSTLYEIYTNKETLVLNAAMSSLEAAASEEESIEPGLKRFIHRLEVIGAFFDKSVKEGEVVARILFENPKNELATEVLLRNLYRARKQSLTEMAEQGQLDLPKNVDQLARNLSSITWGTVLFHYRGLLPTKGMTKELVRASLISILPYATTTSAKRQINKFLPGN